MTKEQKWLILRALPVLDNETWELLVNRLDLLIELNSKYYSSGC